MQRWSIIIHDFMVEDLKLSGVELLVYAVLNGFSAEGGQGYFGALGTLAKRCGCEERQCKRVLQKLIEKHLVKKIERPGMTSVFTTVFKPEQQELLEPDKIPDKPEAEPKERKDSYKDYREVYRQVRKQLGFQDEPKLFSAAIGTRLKDLVSNKKVSVDEFRKCLLQMSQDDFIINTLQFEFQKILSYNIINKYVQQVRKSEPVNTEPGNITWKEKICPKCGGSVFSGLGTCINCYPDKWEQETEMLNGGK